MSTQQQIITMNNQAPTSTSAAASETVNWTRQYTTGYTMTGVELQFTLASSQGVSLSIYDNSLHSDLLGITGYAQGSGTTVNVPIANRGWENSNSGSWTFNFYRRANFATSVTNVQLVFTYQSNAEKSTVTAADAVAGEAQTAAITNEDGTVKHKVTWDYGSGISYGPVTYPASTRYPAWAVPAADLPTLYAANTTTDTITGTITVETLTSDDVSLGSNTCTARLIMPDSVKPGLTVTETKTNDSVATGAGEDYLQNHTTITLAISTTPAYSAAVTQTAVSTPEGLRTISAGSASFLLGRSGSYSITVTATDQRGRTSTWSVTHQVTACEAPVITSVSAERWSAASGGQAQDDGLYVRILATASTTNLSSGTTWRYDIREPGASSATAAGTMTMVSDAATVGGNLDPERSYVLTVTATDSLGQSGGASIPIGTALYTIHRMAGGKGVAFGKAAEHHGVEINGEWPFRTHGQEIMELIINEAHPPGSVLETADPDFDPNTRWPWTVWVEATSGKWTRGV